ncbi:hypothetical protein ACIQB5_50825 [Streptomyces sp. NPDC088560]|uniref:hypothetical protein n=1 Tax=Streptomyces sp. NPDC088560 TaxID=3365868 RepID=UPI0037F3FDAB
MAVFTVSDPESWTRHCTDGFRGEICDWLVANLLDPLAVLWTRPTVVEDVPDGGRVIRCTVIEQGTTVPREIVVPLIVPPPMRWSQREM